MNDAAQHMRILREGWKSMGFQPLTFYVFESDIELVRGEMFERTGERLLMQLPSLSRDQLLQLTDRKRQPLPDLREVLLLDRKLEGAKPSMRKRFDEFRKELTDYMVLRGRYESLDFSTDEEMLYAGARAYAWSYKLYGTWLRLQNWYGDI